jgi:hypothetical protein
MIFYSSDKKIDANFADLVHDENKLNDTPHPNLINPFYVIMIIILTKKYRA